MSYVSSLKNNIQPHFNLTVRNIAICPLLNLKCKLFLLGLSGCCNIGKVCYTVLFHQGIISKQLDLGSVIIQGKWTITAFYGHQVFYLVFYLLHILCLLYKAVSIYSRVLYWFIQPQVCETFYDCMIRSAPSNRL